MEFDINTPAADLAPVVDALRQGRHPAAAAGELLRPHAVDAPRPRTSRTWAAAYGPGGTFWQGKSYPASRGRREIEFGNETSYSYQSATTRGRPTRRRAPTYALARRPRRRQAAIRARQPETSACSRIGDNAGNQSHLDRRHVRGGPEPRPTSSPAGRSTLRPELGDRGSTRRSTRDRAAGARDLPIWITEWGISTDNGRCLCDNYGFDKCMTYDAGRRDAARTLAGMHAPLRQPPRRVLPLPDARPAATGVLRPTARPTSARSRATRAPRAPTPPRSARCWAPARRNRPPRREGGKAPLGLPAALCRRPSLSTPCASSSSTKATLAPMSSARRRSRRRCGR